MWCPPWNEKALAAPFTALFPQLPALGGLAESPLHSQHSWGKGTYEYYWCTSPEQGILDKLVDFAQKPVRNAHVDTCAVSVMGVVFSWRYVITWVDILNALPVCWGWVFFSASSWLKLDRFISKLLPCHWCSSKEISSLVQTKLELIFRDFTAALQSRLFLERTARQLGCWQICQCHAK